MAKVSGAETLIGEDRAFQERSWTLQRFFWVLFALILALVLMGLAGAGGPLSNAQMRSGDAVITYQRTMRWQAVETLQISFASAKDQPLDIRVSPSFFKLFDVDSIMPQPAASMLTRTGTVFRFQAAQGSIGTVSMRLRPLRPFTRFDGSIQVGTGPPARLSVTILP